MNRVTRSGLYKWLQKNEWCPLEDQHWLPSLSPEPWVKKHSRRKSHALRLSLGMGKASTTQAAGSRAGNTTVGNQLSQHEANRSISSLKNSWHKWWNIFGGRNHSEENYSEWSKRHRPPVLQPWTNIVHTRKQHYLSQTYCECCSMHTLSTPNYLKEEVH